MESNLVKRINALDNYQVLRFFNAFGQQLFDGLDTTTDQLKSGIPVSIKSTPVFKQVESLPDDVLQTEMNSWNAVLFARTTLIYWAQDEALAGLVEKFLDNYKDDELGALENLSKGFALAMILFAATSEIKIKIGNMEIVKKSANPETVEASAAAFLKEEQKMIKILFLAANPHDTEPLKLDEEMRAIDIELRKSEFREAFDIKQQWAVRVNDLSEYLLRHQPHIVHFSGHGSNASEIILLDEQDESHPVSIRALSQLFSILKDNIRCVVLNACYGEKQARAIAEHIDCVIGMSKAISDDAAIKFSTAFYRALGFGRNLKTAFDLGCAQIDLESLGEQNTPKLITAKSKPEKIVFVQA